MNWYTLLSGWQLATGKGSAGLPAEFGLVDQMSATTPGPEFEEALRPILQDAGLLPHGRLSSTIGASNHSSRRKRPHSSRVRCV